MGWVTYLAASDRALTSVTNIHPLSVCTHELIMHAMSTATTLLTF